MPDQDRSWKSNQEIERIHTDKHYDYGELLLEDILERRMPDKDLLEIIHPKTNSDHLMTLIRNFFENTKEYSLSKDNIRKHENAPQIISSMRDLANQYSVFTDIESYIVPQVNQKDLKMNRIMGELTLVIGDQLETIVGKERIEKSLNLCGLTILHNMVRKCQGSYFSHYLGTSIEELGLNLYGILNLPFEEVERLKLLEIPFDDMVKFGIKAFVPPNFMSKFNLSASEKRAQEYAANMLFHDGVEDFLNVALDKYGKKYGLAGYNRFMEDTIPKDLRPTVIILSNTNDAILADRYDYLRSIKVPFTLESLRLSLEKLKTPEFKSLDLYIKNIEKNITLLEATGEELYDSALKDQLKSMGYQDYGRNIKKNSVPGNDFSPHRWKNLDGSDNLMSNKDLDRDQKIRNIIKLSYFATSAYEAGFNPKLIGRTGVRGEYSNYFIMETLESSLRFAEPYIISDFIEQSEPMRFFNSGLNKIGSLRSILYKNAIG